MKMYTNSEQTTKLIDLGLPKPKGWNTKNISSRFVMAVDVDADNEFNYSIGELIEMLPPIIVWKRKNLASTIARTTFNSFVSYAELDGTPHIVEKSTELIDALYAMILQLKQEGVI